FKRPNETEITHKTMASQSQPSRLAMGPLASSIAWPPDGLRLAAWPLVRRFHRGRAKGWLRNRGSVVSDSHHSEPLCSEGRIDTSENGRPDSSAFARRVISRAIFGVRRSEPKPPRRKCAL